MATLTKSGRKALERAAKREGGNICPVVDVPVRAATETLMIDALVRLGYVTFDCETRNAADAPTWVTPDADGVYRWGAPRINAAGRKAVEQ
jgi:hypothetical protein